MGFVRFRGFRSRCFLGFGLEESTQFLHAPAARSQHGEEGFVFGTRSLLAVHRVCRVSGLGFALAFGFPRSRLAFRFGDLLLMAK